MTTLQMQLGPNYQAAPTEDLMELASDMDQRAGAGDDIDIVFELTGDDSQDGEDDFMGEEDMNALADSTPVDEREPHAVNDDEMADDNYGQGQFDEGSSVQDENIEDAEYPESELGEDVIVEPDIDLPNDQSEEFFNNYEEIIGNQTHEQDYQEQEYNEQEHDEEEHNERDRHNHPIMREKEPSVVQRVFGNGQTGRMSPSGDVAKGATVKISEGYEVEVSDVGTVNHGPTDYISEPPNADRLVAPETQPGQVGDEVLPASSDSEIAAQLNVERYYTQEGDALHTSANLHPVVLDYQGDEMFLFPPLFQNGDHAATFLLADEQLAYGTIGTLLEACRGVLKESLSEQDELFINIDDLDLHISEFSIDSASTRLSEVIDLYVRLQQNDGVESPPPLYVDLTSRDRTYHRLDVLRNAMAGGKGLSQLKSFQGTENVLQQRIEGETDISSHTAFIRSNRTCASEQQAGEEAEESMEKFDSHSNPLPSENLQLETDSTTQGTQSYSLADVAREENQPTELKIGTDNSPHEAEISDDLFSKAVWSKESREPTPPLATESELQRAEESIVDDGDFIDYEDDEEVEGATGATSSASSTLQGDAIDVNAAQDHAVPEEPIVADKQEHRSTHDVHSNNITDEKILRDLVDEKNTSGVGVPVEEQRHNLAKAPFLDSNDKGQRLFEQLNGEEKATERDQNTIISQEIKLLPEVDADDDQHNISAQYEDNTGSYQHDTLYKHTHQTEDNPYPVADTNLSGEIEPLSFQSGSGESGRFFRNNDVGKVKDSEAENELEEVHRSIANDGNEHIHQPLEEVTTQPSYFVDESAQAQEDDDEITYEDEERDIDILHEPAKAERNVTTSPGSLKRARSFQEDDDGIADYLQGAKRVRSD